MTQTLLTMITSVLMVILVLWKPIAKGEERQCEARLFDKPEANGEKGEIRVLILHPIYAGSHELTLRKFGEELMSRGHQVTQVRWRSSKTRQVNTPVQVITLSPNNSDLR